MERFDLSFPSKCFLFERSEFLVDRFLVIVVVMYSSH